MFKIDAKDIDEFEKHLKTFGKRAYPFASKNTLNRSAFETQKIARRDIDVKMVTRNRFTKQSVQVDQTRTLNVSRQASIVGSIADYMEDQEFGDTRVKSGSEGVSIPTGYAAGQENAQIRTRLPRKGNKLANIRLKRRGRKGKSKKQNNGLKIWQAIATRNRFIFLDLGKTKGIFKVVGGTRRNTEAARLKMVADMSSTSVNIPRNPWLRPAVRRVEVLMPGFHIESLRFQLKRLKLFK